MINPDKFDIIDDTNSILLNEIDNCASVYYSDKYDIVPGIPEDRYDSIFFYVIRNGYNEYSYGKRCRLSMMGPYRLGADGEDLYLSEEDRKELMDILQSVSENGCTVWQNIILSENNERQYSDKKPIPINLSIPDYTKLRPIDIFDNLLFGNLQNKGSRILIRDNRIDERSFNNYHIVVRDDTLGIVSTPNFGNTILYNYFTLEYFSNTILGKQTCRISIDEPSIIACNGDNLVLTKDIIDHLMELLNSKKHIDDKYNIWQILLIYLNEAHRFEDNWIEIPLDLAIPNYYDLIEGE